MTTALFETIGQQGKHAPTGAGVPVAQEQIRWRRQLRRSGQSAFLVALGTATGLCLLAYLIIAPELSMEGADVTLRYLLASIAAVPTVALWIALRGLFWNRRVQRCQESLVQQAFITRCLDQARTDAVLFSPRDRSLLDAARAAEQGGHSISTSSYARALRLVLPVVRSKP